MLHIRGNRLIFAKRCSERGQVEPPAPYRIRLCEELGERSFHPDPFGLMFARLCSSGIFAEDPLRRLLAIHPEEE